METQATWTINANQQEKPNNTSDNTFAHNDNPIYQTTKWDVDNALATPVLDENDGKIIVLDTQIWELPIKYEQAQIEFIKNNPFVSIDYIRELFKDYNWSFESIESIFEKLKNSWLERLKNFDWEINQIFWEDFKQLVEELDQKFQW